MNILKNYLFITFILVGLVSFSSCESEEDLGEKLVNGYCWQGYLPIDDYYGWNDYFSRFFFEGGDRSGYGYEEVYRNGRFQNEYGFDWYWEGSSYAVLVLDYGPRWNQKSCIDVIEIRRGVLRGYFYEYLEDYYRERANGFNNYDREYRYFELTTKQYSRYQ